MNTIANLTLLSALALSSLIAAEPPSAAHSLFQAIREGNAHKVDVLLKDAAAVNARDEHGNTPLMNAAWMADADVMQRLLQAGADANASN